MSRHVVRTPWWINSPATVNRRFGLIVARLPELRDLDVRRLESLYLPLDGAR